MQSQQHSTHAVADGTHCRVGNKEVYPDCHWNALISAPLLDEESGLARLWNYAPLIGSPPRHWASVVRTRLAQSRSACDSGLLRFMPLWSLIFGLAQQLMSRDPSAWRYVYDGRWWWWYLLLVYRNWISSLLRLLLVRNQKIVKVHRQEISASSDICSYYTGLCLCLFWGFLETFLPQTRRDLT